MCFMFKLSLSSSTVPHQRGRWAQCHTCAFAICVAFVFVALDAFNRRLCCLGVVDFVALAPRYETRLFTRITVSEVAYTLTFLTFSNSSALTLSSLKMSEEALGFE